MFLESAGISVEEARPPGLEHCYELELAILGADGGDSVDSYLKDVGSDRVHPLLTNFVDRMRVFRADAVTFGQRWQQWDSYRVGMRRFFSRFDAVLCPVYSQPALRHGESMQDEPFRGFSYTMAWSLAGYPAATVRWSSVGELPINVQVVTNPWRDLTALSLCRQIEEQSGGWQPPQALASLQFTD